MKAIEVDALAVDFGEVVAGVNGVVHVAGRVDGYGVGLAFDIDLFGRVADAGALVVFDADAGGVAHLNGVASDGVEAIECDPAILIARGGEERMGPDPVSADVAERAAGDLEPGGALFQQRSE